MAGRDGPDGGRHAGVVRGEAGLAARARIVALDPGLEPAAAADPDRGQRDRPRAGQADGIEVDDDVVVPVVGVMPAVINPARDPAADHQVGPLAEAHRAARRVPRRLDPHRELVRAVVPDLDLIERDVGRVDDDADRLFLARLQGAAGVRAPPVVVAGAVGDEPPAGATQQFVEPALHQRAAVPRPAQPPGADVDGAGLRAGRTGDEVHRLQQPDRVAEVGQPAAVPVGQVDEEQVGVRRDAGQPARLPVPGRDVQGPGAVAAQAPAVGDGRVVAESLVGPRIGQGPVDLGPAVHGAVSVRLRPRAGRLVTLVPEGQQPGAARPVTGAGLP